MDGDVLVNAPIVIDNVSRESGVCISILISFEGLRYSQSWFRRRRSPKLLLSCEYKFFEREYMLKTLTPVTVSALLSLHSI